MFSIDYPFESIPNGCTWFDEHVPLGGHDLVDIGRNNALSVFQKLRDPIHGIRSLSPRECRVGGLGLREGDEAEVEYGLYNKSWSKRLVKQ